MRCRILKTWIVLLAVAFSLHVANCAVYPRGGGRSMTFYDLETSHLAKSEYAVEMQSDVTVELWLRPAQPSGIQALLSYAIPGDDNFFTFTTNYQGVFGCNVSPDGSFLHPETPTEWHHYAMSYSSQEQTIAVYCDGEHMPGSPFSLPDCKDNIWQSGGTLIIGQEQDVVGGGFSPAEAFMGEVDEIRVWSTPRTQEELKQHMLTPLAGDEPGLVSYWNFDDATDAFVPDLAGSNDLQIIQPSAADISAANAPWIPEGRGAPVRGLGCPHLYTGTARALSTAGVPETIVLAGLGEDGASIFDTVIATLPQQGALFQYPYNPETAQQITVPGTQVTDPQGRLVYLAQTPLQHTDTIQYDIMGTQGTVHIDSRLAPSAYSRAYSSIKEDSSQRIVLGGFDEHGERLHYRVLTLPTQGSLYTTEDGYSPSQIITSQNFEINRPDGAVVFVPDVNTVGEPYGSFTFAAANGDVDAGTAQLSAEAEVSLSVTPVDDLPVSGGALFALSLTGKDAISLSRTQGADPVFSRPVHVIECNIKLTDPEVVGSRVILSLVEATARRQIDIAAIRGQDSSQHTLELLFKADTSSTVQVSTSCILPYESFTYIGISLGGASDSSSAFVACGDSTSPLDLGALVWDPTDTIPTAAAVGASFDGFDSTILRQDSAISAEIDELRFWMEPRGEEGVLRDARTKYREARTNLIAFSFDEGSGNVAKSVSGEWQMQSMIPFTSVKWVISSAYAYTDTELYEDGSIEFVLDGADVENTYSLVPIIVTLPSKGRLYQVGDDGVRGAEIAAPFYSWTALRPEQQWVSRIVGFSTQWGATQAYTAANLIGEPAASCEGTHGDCTLAWCPATMGNADGEFLELEFEKAVHPQAIEILENYYPGAIQRISAKNPTGEWIPIWTGIDEKCNADTNENTEFRYFEPDPCKTNFVTNQIRIELETAKCYGWNELLGVRLTGPTAVKEGIITNAKRKVVYVPDADAVGEDSFEYTVIDCAFNLRRSANTIRQTLSISPVNDAPVSTSTSLVDIDEDTKLDFDLQGADVDGDELAYRITSLPRHGTLQDANGNRIAAAPHTTATASVTYRPNTGECGTNFDSLSFVAVDPPGAQSAEATVAIDMVRCKPGTHIIPDSLKTAVMVAGGIVCAIILTASIWLLVMRHKPIIKAASPVFCVLVAIGCLVMSVAVFFDVQLASPTVCVLRIWLRGIGFSLAFGSVFAKTWRIFKIFGNRRLSKLRISNFVLLRVVATFTIVEVVYLLVWQLVSPVSTTSFVDTADPSKTHVVCTADPTLFSIFLAEKGILLLGGSFLSLSTRAVVVEFNESKFNGMIIYNTMAFGVLFVVFAQGVASESALLAIMSFGTLYITAFITLALWIPKIISHADVQRRMTTAQNHGSSAMFATHQSQSEYNMTKISGS